MGKYQARHFQEMPGNSRGGELQEFTVHNYMEIVVNIVVCADCYRFVVNIGAYWYIVHGTRCAIIGSFVSKTGSKHCSAFKSSPARLPLIDVERGSLSSVFHCEANRSCLGNRPAAVGTMLYHSIG